jgi:hypothetical protein
VSDAPRRAARMVLVAVVLQALYVFFFVVPGHDPEPNGLPVAAVTGPAGGPALAASLPGVDLREVPGEAAARRLILDREVYGAVLADGGRVLVASAASVPVAEMLRGRAGDFEVVDLVPVDEDDPRGVTLNLLVLPLIVTGILVALVAAGLLQGVGVRGRVLLSGLAAFLGSLATIGIVSGLIGALPGPYLALVGVTTLAVWALALTAGGLVAVLGQGGIALAFVIFLMMGAPASGLATAPELLPTPWQELGPLLPPGALGSALRGTAYFDGAGVAGPLLVLLAWCGIGVALHGLAGRRPAAPQPAGG